MLVTDIQAEGRREWADDARRIYDSGKYLLELINDILDISKIEAGKMEGHVERFQVAALLRDATEALRPLVGQKANRLNIRAADDVAAVDRHLIKVWPIPLDLVDD